MKRGLPREERGSVWPLNPTVRLLAVLEYGVKRAIYAYDTADSLHGIAGEATAVLASPAIVCRASRHAEKAPLLVRR